MRARNTDRTAEVLAVLRFSRVPLDDDEIATLTKVNRHYVNAICRRLAADQLITRNRGASGKLVNMIIEPSATAGTPTRTTVEAQSSRRSTHRRAPDGLPGNIDQLVNGFAGFVAAFERRQAFPGPSLYFHLRAIERRRQHHTVASLLDDLRFLEYVYAVLPAWGMQRMGPQAAKVDDFTRITTALRQTTAALETLWPRRITALQPDEADGVAATAWSIVDHLKVSTSRTQIVAGSKFVHHLLPDLIPPIDRQYTFMFFTGQKNVPGDRRAFLTWYPRLAEIGTRCRQPIQDAIRRQGFMATGEAKIIDNAIMGFMQQRTIADQTT
jgi:DNA-binding GntR family transcriptional regulator